MTKLQIMDIEGIGPTYAKKFQSININTSDDLLEKGNTPQGRKEIAEKSDISEKLILKWVNMANLVRVKGVGEEYSKLLEITGISSVAELSNCNAKDLQENMQKVNAQKNLVKRPPTLNEVEEWIEQSQNLPIRVEYSSSDYSVLKKYGNEKKSESNGSLDELIARVDKLEERVNGFEAQLTN